MVLVASINGWVNRGFCQRAATGMRCKTALWVSLLAFTTLSNGTGLAYTPFRTPPFNTAKLLAAKLLAATPSLCRGLPQIPAGSQWSEAASPATD